MIILDKTRGAVRPPEGGGKGSWVSTFGMLVRASGRAYFFCSFCEKVTKKIGSLDLVPYSADCSKRRTYFRTLFQKTEWYLRLWTAQNSFGKNPRKSVQTDTQTQDFTNLVQPTKKPPSGGQLSTFYYYSVGKPHVIL